MPLLLSASKDLLKRYLPAIASGDGDVLLRSVRAGGRQRRGGDADHGGPRRRPLRAQRREALDHQRGHLRVLHGDGGDGPDAGANGISAFVVEKSDEGFTFGAPEKKLGIKGSPTRELYFDDCRIPADRLVGPRAPASRPRCAPWTTPGSRSPHRRSGIAAGALAYATSYAKERKQFGKSISEFQGIQFMLADMAMKVETPGR
jgi:hypothetical protein